MVVVVVDVDVESKDSISFCSANCFGSIRVERMASSEVGVASATVVGKETEVGICRSAAEVVTDVKSIKDCEVVGSCIRETGSRESVVGSFTMVFVVVKGTVELDENNFSVSVNCDCDGNCWYDKGIATSVLSELRLVLGFGFDCKNGAEMVSTAFQSALVFSIGSG